MVNEVCRVGPAGMSGLFAQLAFELFEALELGFDALTVAVLAFGVVFELVSLAFLGAAAAELNDVFGNREQVALSERLRSLTQVDGVIGKGGVGDAMGLCDPVRSFGFGELANPVHISGEVGIAVALIFEA